MIFFFIGYWFLNLLLDFYHIAWGTGDWLGEFSLKWGLGLVIFAIFLIFLLAILWLFLWRNEILQPIIQRFVFLRQKLSFLRWILVPLFLIFPIYIFQYTLWGLVFTDTSFRIFVWLFQVIFLAILLTREERNLISWHSLLLSVLLTSTSYTLANVFSYVSDYPFNLYWSDGNRLWDYSLMFGRERYNYPPDQPIKALISSGRQFLWGLPYLLPNSTILFHRFWSALVLSFPYAVLGWVAFKDKDKKNGFLIGLWLFVFLHQGPIYTPLVLSAILVAIAWEKSLWIAIPLVAIAGYYAESARYTWEFAPAIWAGVLSLNGSKLKGTRLSLHDWGRAILLGIAGISLWLLAGKIPDVEAGVSQHPLLWYRLLPNDTYPEGILGGLLIATLPIIILLLYLVKKKYWRPSVWQKLAILGSLFAFLFVGVIISTKMGGGNNLHNLDMFLIALLFTAAIAWKNGGSEWLSETEKMPFWVKITLIFLIALPALSPLQKLEPRLSLSKSEIKTVQILADTETVNALPDQNKIYDAIWFIRHAINDADEGEVLFIDQRQLLTFGVVPKIPLVPEYEKKRMMNEAMASNATYFASYYEDLANHRFALIITEPLKIDLKNQEGIFAEESDAWGQWVAAPTLCYYEPIQTMHGVYIELLIPRQEALDCSAYLP